MNKVFKEVSDWANVKVGDRVRLDRSGIIYEFIVFGVGEILKERVLVGNNNYIFYNFSDSILFVERPAAQLPTEPGYYLDSDGEVWDLRTSGELVCISCECYEPEDCGPFRRMRPADEELQ